MSNFLFAAVAAQTALLGLVVAKLASLEAHVAAQSAAAQALDAASTDASASLDGPVAAELRAIVRGELAAAKSALADASARRDVATPVLIQAAPDPHGQSAAKVSATATSVGQVRAQLTSYIARGRMSGREMDAFYDQIAELSQDDRRAMLRELTTA
ncbi:MAG: hypothetical protein K2Q06_06170, partial [Parvularculaceae bacterium]|nr:hypothetical protein [Parvularculaceae bacterium]